jgi:recombination protein RecA
VKNKVAPPFRIAEFDILYSEGISKEGNLLDIGIGLNIIKKSGAFHSFGDTRLGQGRENAREYLKQNPEIAAEIERLIREQTAAARAPAPTPAPVTLPAGDGALSDELADILDRPAF